MSYHPELAKLINDALARLDRSPSWLAQRLGVNPSTVSRWLNQGMRPGDPETVARIADVLGLSAQVQAFLMAAGFGYVETTVPAVDDKTSIRLPRDLEHVLSPIAAPLPVISLPIYKLPAQATPFVARQAETAAVLELLAQPACRLVTITGAGGIGKTRLSIAVAGEAAPQFADGVCFVSFANVEMPQAIPRTIAAALDLPEMGAVDAHRLLYNALSTKNLLLVLDNLEHLIEGADFLSDLLQQAPHLTILVTSRERLNLVEEWIYRLEGLSYPPAETPDLDEEYGAITFFVQCARKSQPDFDPKPAWLHITSICQLVEGMPLGIELAASWVRVMSCAEIAVKLAQDADLLTTPLRNLPTRHRSLRAVFERSWQLLTPEEQTVLCQLSVFRGGFDRHAAERVAGATPLMLAALIDQSLLQRQSSGRFDMHRLLHRFAVEKLADAPQMQTQVRTCHAEFYADLASRAGWELEPGDEEVKEALRSETSNLLAAWRWATETQNRAVISRMIKPLANYYDYAGWDDETYRAFDVAIQTLRRAAPKTGTVGLLGSLLLRMAMAYPPYRVQERYTALSEAVRLLEDASPTDDLELALAYCEFGIGHAGQGHNPAAITMIEKALALFQSVDNTLGEGHALLRLGLVKLGGGQPQQAAKYLEASARLFETEDEDAFARSLHIWGTALQMRGHYQQAEVLYRRALTFAVANRRILRVGAILCGLAELATFTGKFSEAARHYQEAHAHLDPLNRSMVVTLGYQLSPGVLARLRGDPGAEQQLIDTLAAARQVGFQQRLATTLHHLSRFRYEQGDYEGTLALLDEALTIAQQIDYRYAISLVLVQRGHTYLAMNRTDEARHCYAQALQITGDEGIDHIALDALCGVAILFAQEGNQKRTIAFLHLAHEHPASDYETKHRATYYLHRITSEASATVTEEPDVDRTLDLEEAIRIALQWAMLN